MTSKLDGYDFIAALIPGILFLWWISIFACIQTIPLTGGLADTSVLFALAYVTGLILQGISQGLTEKILLKLWGGFPSARWLLPDDNNFSKEYKDKIKEIINVKYSIKADDSLPKEEKLKKNQEIFYLCYNAVEKEKLSDRPQIFNAHYGLFRCLLTTFSLLVLFGVGVLFIDKPQNSTSIWCFMIIALVGAIVSYFRAQKRGEDFAKSIYDLFLVKFSE